MLTNPLLNKKAVVNVPAIVKISVYIQVLPHARLHQKFCAVLKDALTAVSDWEIVLKPARKMQFILILIQISLVIDPEKCNGCGLCVKECPRNVIKLVPANSKIVFLCNYQDLRDIPGREKCDSGCIKMQKMCKGMPK